MAAGELAVMFGLIGLITGPLWGRKAWGVWWQWDARLTMALLLELIFTRAICWCGSTAARDRRSSPRPSAIFGAANVPFVYMSVNIWRTIHPKTTVVPTLRPGDGRRVLVQRLALLLLFYVLLMALRVTPRAASAPSSTSCIWRDED